MTDFVPANDAEFNSWQGNLVNITDSNVAAWGINVDDFTKLTADQVVWQKAYSAAEIKKARNEGDVQGKVSAREVYEKAVRAFVKQWLSFNTRVSDRDRELMGLTVKSEERTPVSKPTTVPVGKIDFSKRLQHIVHFVDEATPTRKAKPEGAHGCEVWVKFGGVAPVEPSELSYVSTSTRTPCIATIEGKHAGQIAYYWLRWVNTRGEHGPWSNTISATVAG